MMSWSNTTGPMPQPDDRPNEALDRLNEELQAFEAGRAGSASSVGANHAVGEGYRLLGELIGGVLGGLGLGWLVDRLAHTAPWGIAVGLALGAGVSVYLAATTAARMGRKAMLDSGPLKPSPDQDDD